MVQSLQITGMKQNVLFLQRASMRKLIKGKHEKRCSFLERKGDRRSRWIVDSTLFEYRKAEGYHIFPSLERKGDQPAAGGK